MAANVAFQRGGDAEGFRVVDDVIGKRRQARDAAKAKRDDELRRLNEERRSIQLERKKLTEQKQGLLGGGAAAATLGLADRPDSASSLARRTTAALDQQQADLVLLKKTLVVQAAHRPYAYDGRYGVESYPASQLPAYHFCRGLVLQLADAVPGMVAKRLPDPVRAVIARDVWDAQRMDLEHQSEATTRVAAVSGFYAELEEVVVAEMARSIASEIVLVQRYAAAKASGLLISAITSHSVDAFGNSMKVASVEKLMGRLLGDMQRKRAAGQRDLVIRHRQPLKLSQGGPGAKAKVVEGYEGEPDALAFDDADDADIVTVQLPHRRTRPSDPGSPAWAEPSRPGSPGSLDGAGGPSSSPVGDVAVNASLAPYHQLVQEYWRNARMTRSQTDLPKGLKGGVVAAAVSVSTGKFVAATSNGDMVVNYMHESAAAVDEPEQPAVMVPHRLTTTRDVATSHKLTSVLSTCWSLDGVSLLSTDTAGAVMRWSVAPNTLSRKGVGELIMLNELTQADLQFITGPFSDGVDSGKKATVAAFFPSFTLFGQQPSCLVGQEHGDILKIDFPCTAKVYPRPPRSEDGIRSVIGGGLVAELLRGHRHPIMYVGSRNNSMSLVSADAKGYIFFWEFTEETRTPFGWFAPTKKYHFDFATTEPQPQPGEATLVFSSAKGEHPSKAKMHVAREAAEQMIDGAGISGAAWHSYKKKKVTTEAYLVIPDDAGGPFARDDVGTFHIVSRNQSMELTEYKTQPAVSVPNPCELILGIRATPKGGCLLSMCLFAPTMASPAEVHVLSVDLSQMAVSDVRVQIKLSDAEYKYIKEHHSTCCSFEITHVFEGLDTDLVVTAIAGTLRVHCLMTGVEIELFKQLIPELPLVDSSISLVMKPGENKFTIVAWNAKNLSLLLTQISDFNTVEQVDAIRRSVEPAAKSRLQYKMAPDAVGWALPKKSDTTAIPLLSASVFIGRLKGGVDARSAHSWARQWVLAWADKAVSRAHAKHSAVGAARKAGDVPLPGTPTEDDLGRARPATAGNSRKTGLAGSGPAAAGAPPPEPSIQSLSKGRGKGRGAGAQAGSARAGIDQAGAQAPASPRAASAAPSASPAQAPAAVPTPAPAAPTQPQAPQRIFVKLSRANSQSLGCQMASDSRGFAISKVAGQAAQLGTIQVGDRVVMINGVALRDSFVMADVGALIKKSETVKMTLERPGAPR